MVLLHGKFTSHRVVTSQKRLLKLNASETKPGIRVYYFVISVSCLRGYICKVALVQITGWRVMSDYVDVLNASEKMPKIEGSALRWGVIQGSLTACCLKGRQVY